MKEEKNKFIGELLLVKNDLTMERVKDILLRNVKFWYLFPKIKQKYEINYIAILKDIDDNNWWLEVRDKKIDYSNINIEEFLCDLLKLKNNWKIDLFLKELLINPTLSKDIFTEYVSKVYFKADEIRTLITNSLEEVWNVDILKNKYMSSYAKSKWEYIFDGLVERPDFTAEKVLNIENKFENTGFSYLNRETILRKNKENTEELLKYIEGTTHKNLLYRVVEDSEISTEFLIKYKDKFNFSNQPKYVEPHITTRLNKKIPLFELKGRNLKLLVDLDDYLAVKENKYD